MDYTDRYSAGVLDNLLFCVVQYYRHDTSGETQVSSGQMHLIKGT